MRRREYRQPGRKELPLNEREIKHYYVNEGWTTREIAERFGVSQSTITRRLHKMGVRMRRLAWM